MGVWRVQRRHVQQTTRSCRASTHIVPVDIYLPGCPPRPEMLLDSILKLHDKIMNMKLGKNRDHEITELENARLGLAPAAPDPRPRCHSCERPRQDQRRGVAYGRGRRRTHRRAGPAGAGTPRRPNPTPTRTSRPGWARKRLAEPVRPDPACSACRTPPDTSGFGLPPGAPCPRPGQPAPVTVPYFSTTSPDGPSARALEEGRSGIL